MGKIYIKNPIEIEAVEWMGSKESWDEIMNMGLKEWNPGEMGSKTFYIMTLEGEMKAEYGDFIIKEPFANSNRKFYPCKPDIFKKTYTIKNEEL